MTMWNLDDEYNAGLTSINYWFSILSHTSKIVKIGILHRIVGDR